MLSIMLFLLGKEQASTVGCAWLVSLFAYMRQIFFRAIRDLNAACTSVISIASFILLEMEWHG
jgi:hypothetical protein